MKSQIMNVGEGLYLMVAPVTAINDFLSGALKGLNLEEAFLEAAWFGLAVWIIVYPIVAASGRQGPKLREGDKQVPEGLYRINAFNPNSQYHLSMLLSYPNRFDRAMGRKENRTNLGGDIMIHGKSSSAGCLAMGDEAAEDFFVLVAETGRKNVHVVMSPYDFYSSPPPAMTKKDLPPWTGELYEAIDARLKRLPQPTFYNELPLGLTRLLTRLGLHLDASSFQAKT